MNPYISDLHSISLLNGDLSILLDAARGATAIHVRYTMFALSEHHDPELNDRLRDTPAATAGLMSEVIAQTCRRFPSMGQTEKTARIERLIGSGAWTDARLR